MARGAPIAGTIVTIGADSYEFSKGLKGVQSDLKKFQVEISGIGKSLTSKLAGPLASIGIAFAGKKLIGEAIEVRTEFQRAAAAFEVFLGAKKANTLIGDIRKISTETGMMRGSLEKAAQTLLSFGVSDTRIVPTLKQIGDIAMGDAQKFQSLTLAFSQMTAAGRLMGQDLNQMINAGFNPLMIISEKTGRSLADLKKEMEQGAISSEMVAQAFAEATAKGGKFHGMLEKQNQGFAGLKSSLKSLGDDLKNTLGEILEPLILKVGNAIKKLMQWFNELSPITKRLIVTIGAFVAAIGPVSIAISGVIRLLPVLKAALLAIPSPVGIAITAVMALAAAFMYLAEAQNRAFRKLEGSLFEENSVEELERLIAENQKKQEEVYAKIRDKKNQTVYMGEFVWKNPDTGQMELMQRLQDTAKSLITEELALSRAVDRKRKEQDVANSATQEAIGLNQTLQEMLSGTADKTEVVSGRINILKQRIADLTKQRDLLPAGSYEQVAAINAELEEMNKELAMLQSIKPRINIAPIDLSGITLAGLSAPVVSTRNYFNPIVEKLWADKTKLAEQMAAIQAQVDELFQSFAENTFSGIGEIFGNAIAGDLEDGLRGFASIFASFLTQVGKMTIQIGVAMLGLKAALKVMFTNPVTAIAAGIALVAVGAALQGLISKASKPPALAQGGLAFGPTYAMVGDNRNAGVDPEVIAPLSKLKKYLQPADQTGGQVEFVIRGDQLVGILNRANKQSKLF